VAVSRTRLLAAGFGVALVAGGVAAVFTDNAAGGASLLALGALTVAVAVFSDRIESVEFGAAKLKLRDLARQRFELAAEKERQGDAAAAQALRKQARGFQRLAGTYGRTRHSMSGGPDRTRALDDVMSQAQELARTSAFDPAEVWTWFDGGADEARVIALGLMLGDERLSDFFCALDAIEDSRSLFELYYGLKVAHEMLRGLSPLERDWLRAAVHEACSSKRIPQEDPVMSLCKEILSTLDGGATGSAE
jgi:hypothetical protein